MVQNRRRPLTFNVKQFFLYESNLASLIVGKVLEHSLARYFWRWVHEQNQFCFKYKRDWAQRRRHETRPHQGQTCSSCSSGRRSFWRIKLLPAWGLLFWKGNIIWLHCYVPVPWLEIWCAKRGIPRNTSSKADVLSMQNRKRKNIRWNQQKLAMIITVGFLPLSFATLFCEVAQQIFYSRMEYI